jgi:hypothetical protein
MLRAGLSLQGVTGPNGGAIPAAHQDVLAERAKRRYNNSRKRAGQTTKRGGPYGANKAKKRGTAGERPRERRRREGNPLKKRIDDGQHKGDGAGNEHQKDITPSNTKIK